MYRIFTCGRQHSHTFDCVPPRSSGDSKQCAAGMALDKFRIRRNGLAGWTLLGMYTCGYSSGR